MIYKFVPGGILAHEMIEQAKKRKWEFMRPYYRFQAEEKQEIISATAHLAIGMAKATYHVLKAAFKSAKVSRAARDKANFQKYSNYRISPFDTKVVMDNSINPPKQVTLHRVVANIDIKLPDGRVIKAGTQGGYVRNERNLSQTTPSWLADGCVISGANSRISGVIEGNVQLGENVNAQRVTMKGNIRMDGANGGKINLSRANFTGNVMAFGNCELHNMDVRGGDHRGVGTLEFNNVTSPKTRTANKNTHSIIHASGNMTNTTVSGMLMHGQIFARDCNFKNGETHGLVRVVSTNVNGGNLHNMTAIHSEINQSTIQEADLGRTTANGCDIRGHGGAKRCKINKCFLDGVKAYNNVTLFESFLEGGIYGLNARVSNCNITNGTVRDNVELSNVSGENIEAYDSVVMTNCHGINVIARDNAQISGADMTDVTVFGDAEIMGTLDHSTGTYSVVIEGSEIDSARVINAIIIRSRLSDGASIEEGKAYESQLNGEIAIFNADVINAILDGKISIICQEGEAGLVEDCTLITEDGEEQSYSGSVMLLGVTAEGNVVAHNINLQALGDGVIFLQEGLTAENFNVIYDALSDEPLIFSHIDVRNSSIFAMHPGLCEDAGLYGTVIYLEDGYALDISNESYENVSIVEQNGELTETRRRDEPTMAEVRAMAEQFNALDREIERVRSLGGPEAAAAYDQAYAENLAAFMAGEAKARAVREAGGWAAYEEQQRAQMQDYINNFMEFQEAERFAEAVARYGSPEAAREGLAAEAEAYQAEVDANIDAFMAGDAAARATAAAEAARIAREEEIIREGYAAFEESVRQYMEGEPDFEEEEELSKEEGLDPDFVENMRQFMEGDAAARATKETAEYQEAFEENMRQFIEGDARAQEVKDAEIAAAEEAERIAKEEAIVRDGYMAFEENVREYMESPTEPQAVQQEVETAPQQEQIPQEDVERETPPTQDSTKLYEMAPGEEYMQIGFRQVPDILTLGDVKTTGGSPVSIKQNRTESGTFKKVMAAGGNVDPAQKEIVEQLMKSSNKINVLGRLLNEEADQMSPEQLAEMTADYEKSKADFTAAQNQFNAFYMGERLAPEAKFNLPEGVLSEDQVAQLGEMTNRAMEIVVDDTIMKTGYNNGQPIDKVGRSEAHHDKTCAIKESLEMQASLDQSLEVQKVEDKVTVAKEQEVEPSQPAKEQPKPEIERVIPHIRGSGVLQYDDGELIPVKHNRWDSDAGMRKVVIADKEQIAPEKNAILDRLMDNSTKLMAMQKILEEGKDLPPEQIEECRAELEASKIEFVAAQNDLNAMYMGDTAKFTLPDRDLTAAECEQIQQIALRGMEIVCDEAVLETGLNNYQRIDEQDRAEIAFDIDCAIKESLEMQASLDQSLEVQEEAEVEPLEFVPSASEPLEFTPSAEDVTQAEAEEELGAVRGK